MTRNTAVAQADELRTFFTRVRPYYRELFNMAHAVCGNYEVAEYAVQGERVKEKIDERLLSAYDRIRRNVRNGLAVVTVKRDACGGCFNRIPPQRQVDIRQGKKIIICEYCGRILVADPDEAQE